jgi:hypothetical protein
MGVLWQVVVEVRGVGSQGCYPLDPLDEVMEVLRPLDAVWLNEMSEAPIFSA